MYIILIMLLLYFFTVNVFSSLISVKENIYFIEANQTIKCSQMKVFFGSFFFTLIVDLN